MSTLTSGTASGARSAGQRSRFVDDRVATASPQALLVMLYERLVVDLDHAEAAQRRGERETARRQLMHAQDIVNELLSSLDVTVWDAAEGLASLYTFLLTELIQANITGDAARTRSCRTMVEPLRDAWREAAVSVVASPAG